MTSSFITSNALLVMKECYPHKGEDLSGTRIYIMQNFMPIGCTSAEISVPTQKNTQNHLKLNILQNAY